MASIILGAAGSLLGPVGGALGALVGAFVDQRFLNPLLAPKPTVEGPRIADFRLQQQEEGAGANWILGGPSRVGSVFIWAAPIREVKVEEEVGGKGGGGQKVTSYAYYTTVAISYAIQSGVTIDRILAEGTVVYDANPNKTVTSTGITAAAIGTTDLRMKLTAPDGGADLSRFRSGYDVTITGFANGANNGTWQVEQAGVEAGGTFVIVKNGSAVAEAAGASVTVAQTLPSFDPTKVEEVNIHTGSQTTADATIESYRGSGNVPAYHGTAFVVLKNLALAPYGNRVPLFSFEVTASIGTSIQTAVEEICRRAGLQSGQYDAATLSGANRGYALNGPVAPAAALQPLLLRHDVLTQEADAKIRFFHRANATIVYIPRAQISAAPGLDTERPDPWEIARGDAFQLPPRIFVSYIRAENGERGGEPHVRNGAESTAVQNVYLPLAMTAAEARAVEKRLSYAAKVATETHRLKLGPKWVGLGENDVIATWWTPGELLFLQVIKIDVSPDYNVDVEAQLWYRALATQSAEADDAGTELGEIGFAGAIDGALFETPAIGGGTGPSDRIRLPAAVAMPDDDDPYPGVLLLGSLDDEEFHTLATLTQESTFGRARTALGGSGIDPATWDRVSTVEVEVWNGTLESRDESDVLAGANVALCGSEVIQFATATLVSPRRYTLSNLLRGRRDTVDVMTTHAADERFLLLTAPGPVMVELELTALGSPRYFKFVPNGANPADYASQTLSPAGRNLRPFAPHALVGVRDEYGNLDVSWTRRTRVPLADLPDKPVPLGEETETYDVEFWWSAALVRSLTVTSPTTTYTESQQTTDGVTLFTDLEVRVYQRSSSYGRGRALEGTV